MKTPDLIRERRLVHSFTQQRLGEIMGYTGNCAQVTVATWESGKSKVPRKKIKKLAELLEIPIELLIS